MLRAGRGYGPYEPLTEVSSCPPFRINTNVIPVAEATATATRAAIIPVHRRYRPLTATAPRTTSPRTWVSTSGMPPMSSVVPAIVVPAATAFGCSVASSNEARLSHNHAPAMMGSPSTARTQNNTALRVDFQPRSTDGPFKARSPWSVHAVGVGLVALLRCMTRPGHPANSELLTDGQLVPVYLWLFIGEVDVGSTETETRSDSCHGVPRCHGVNERQGTAGDASIRRHGPPVIFRRSTLGDRRRRSRRLTRGRDRSGVGSGTVSATDSGESKNGHHGNRRDRAHRDPHLVDFGVRADSTGAAEQRRVLSDRLPIADRLPDRRALACWTTSRTRSLLRPLQSSGSSSAGRSPPVSSAP
ncbi:hypothetical protein EDF31_1116 [Curtobacterium sp. PhB142]|nr:hypothetical protein EDF31_1116 [Curtobacterium sp. PhB142]TCL99895.1 hypothetical protein EDF26_11279 [Curtobacterium sp. PhB134]TDW72236.1 hypothetical protein EDF51_104301 [Curtobacterium sp. PhB25]